MSYGLAPEYPVDSSHPETPGFKGALMRDTEAFGRSVGAQTSDGGKEIADPLSNAIVLARAQEAHTQAKQFYDVNLAGARERTYKAFRNQHFSGSKYNSVEFKGRSKMFRPKTKSAVRKQMTNAANALFANADVVTISAQDESNPQQRASAAIKKQLINYRLDRKSRRNGIRWFQICLGARMDATLAGFAVSKQSWRFMKDDGGNVIEDRPDVLLYPPENVMLDPNANWVNPAQSGAFVILKNPMSPEDAMAMIEADKMGKTPFEWLPVSENVFYAGGRSENITTESATRQARTGGTDPKQDAHGHFQQIWLHEVFMRIQGKEYVFWMLGTTTLLSRPKLVREAYPAFKGERPVVQGFGALESHTPFPMSPGESWQPLQQEANDQANLRLDHMKLKVDPPTKIRRGQKVDMQQVQRKGPGSVILVQEHTDIETHEVPDVPQSAYVENNYLNADFDDLAGSFNAGTVQTNRSLNETVGGMKLLSADANAVGEFDLSVFVETWVEPVLWQLMKLEEFYENDATVLAIAGKKGMLLERYGINEITDTLLLAETSLTVNVGVGSASSPAEKVNRFVSASAALGQILGPLIAAGVAKPPVPKVGEMIDTVFGGAGFHDALDRFFHPIDDDKPPEPPQQEGPPPDPAGEAKAQAIMMKAQQDKELHELKMKIERDKAQMEFAGKQLDYALKVQDARLEANMREQQAQLDASIQQGEAEVRRKQAEQSAKMAGEKHTQALTAAQQKAQMQGEAAASKPSPSGGAQRALPAPAPMPALPAPEREEDPEPEDKAIVSTLQQIAQVLAAATQTLERMEAQQNAPAELMRDERGQTVGVRKGNREQRIVRDGMGRPAGLAPA